VLVLLLVAWLLLRPKRIVVTDDFVQAMIDAEAVSQMTAGRWRWVVPLAAAGTFDGVVREGVDLGSLLHAEPNSPTDAGILAEKLDVDGQQAALLAMAKRYGTLCTENQAVSALAVSLGVTVYDRAGFGERFAAGGRG
jgi:hypothetical protein